MPKTERLPKHVSSFIDVRGKRRYRFRKGGVSRYFEAHPNSEQGGAEYAMFLAACGSAEPAHARKPIAGSVDALMALYYASTDFAGNAGAVSLAKRRAVLERFRAEHGHRPAATATYVALDKYIAAVAKGDGKHGGQFAAETARKLLRGLFAFAVKIGWRADNPMQFVTYRPRKTEGFHNWTEAEIEQYQAHWPLGTKQRLAMELMLWTGRRRGDAIGLGPQHVVNGSLAGRDAKTGKRWELPIAPQLREALDAMPVSDHLCFIPSERGRAYSAASFGNQFKRWCREAALPHCTAHGLRKAISRRLAEEGIGNAGIKSVTLHSRDEEVALYVAAADQKKLARTAIERISERQLSNAAEGGLSNKSENG